MRSSLTGSHQIALILTDMANIHIYVPLSLLLHEDLLKLFHLDAIQNRA